MKKISRRSFLTAAAACGAAAALSACGGSSASSTAASSTAGSTAASAAAGPVTLQWSVWDKESTPYWQAMADGYMASHKDVTIEMVDLGSSDYMTVLATQLAGSADLDVVTVKDIPGRKPDQSGLPQAPERGADPRHRRFQRHHRAADHR